MGLVFIFVTTEINEHTFVRIKQGIKHLMNTSDSAEYGPGVSVNSSPLLQKEATRP